MDPVIAPTAFFIAAGLGMVAYLARPSATQRALRRLSSSTIADAPPERIVRIEGVVETDAPPLTAPLSGRACAYWRLEIDASIGDPKLRSEEGQQIRVRDASGVVTVDLTAARVEGGSRFDARGHTASRERMAPGLAALVEMHRIGTSALGRSVWAREFIVATGDRVACGGRVRQDVVADASGDAGYRGTPSRLVLQPSADRPVLVIVLDEASSSSS